MSSDQALSPAILIAETDPVIALDLETRLVAAGFEVVGPVNSPGELHRLLSLPFAGAVVSSGALGPDIEATLAPMTQRDVPVLVVSGLDGLGPHVRAPGVTIVPKPADLDDVVARLHEALATHRAAGSV